MNSRETTSFDRVELIQRLQAEDGPADLVAAFPTRLWAILDSVGAPRWSLPTSFGGLDLDRVALMERYSAIAEGSLAAAFILSQHDASIRRLVAVQDRPVASRWLEKLGRGEAFTTIGVSQLTTSRRLGSQALRARAEADGSFTLDGAMPWVTAAERADVFVTGAVCEDGLQILIALPADRAGVEVKPAFPIAALTASRTAEVVCTQVRVEASELLGGPVADVMAHINAAGTGGLETSALGLGLARAAVKAMETEINGVDDLVEPVDVLRASVEEAWKALVENASGASGAPTSASVRARSNALALRCTQAYLTARRGRGLLLTDPAQQWARQALFFLVWSCPTPVAHAAIRDLAGLCSL